MVKTYNPIVSARSFYKSFLLLVAVLILPCFGHTQPAPDASAAQNLFNEIAAADAALFGAFNSRDVEKFKALLTEDLEFYHDKDGFSKSRESEVKSFEALCRQPMRVRRELVAGSLEVFPIPNYGATQLGTHRFYETEPGREEKLVGIARFLHVWQKKDGEWKLARVISYDHKPATAETK